MPSTMHPSRFPGFWGSSANGAEPRNDARHDAREDIRTTFAKLCERRICRKALDYIQLWAWRQVTIFSQPFGLACQPVQMRALRIEEPFQSWTPPAAHAGSSPTLQVPAWAVLDTNVLLDLLVFDDWRARALGQALAAGQLLALATAPMFDELADVLARPFVTPWCSDVGLVLARARALCRLVDCPPAAPAPRCADPDDQKFIDLAWAWPAAWLISRDRALLALARPALQRQLRVLTPAGWAEAQTSSA